ncbi:MAG: hypothetical protein ACNA8P_11670, partial [Phycisphaerales bacterium]
SSSSLVGKFVTGLTESSAEVAGFVDSVTITRDGIKLNLSSGFSIGLNRISEIIDPDIIAIGNPDGGRPPDPNPVGNPPTQANPPQDNPPANDNAEEQGG